MPISKNVYLKICIKFKNIYIKICFGACIWTQVRIFCSIKIVCQRKGYIVFLLSISCIFCCRFGIRLSWNIYTKALTLHAGKMQYFVSLSIYNYRLFPTASIKYGVYGAIHAS